MDFRMISEDIEVAREATKKKHRGEGVEKWK